MGEGVSVADGVIVGNDESYVSVFEREPAKVLRVSTAEPGACAGINAVITPFDDVDPGIKFPSKRSAAPAICVPVISTYPPLTGNVDGLTDEIVGFAIMYVVKKVPAEAEIAFRLNVSRQFDALFPAVRTEPSLLIAIELS